MCFPKSPDVLCRVKTFANGLQAARSPFTSQHQLLRVSLLSHHHSPFSFRRPVYLQHRPFRDSHLQADGQHDKEGKQLTARTAPTSCALRIR